VGEIPPQQLFGQGAISALLFELSRFIGPTVSFQIERIVCLDSNTTEMAVTFHEGVDDFLVDPEGFRKLAAGIFDLLKAAVGQDVRIPSQDTFGLPVKFMVRRIE